MNSNLDAEMLRNIRKLNLLLWKNLVIQKRRPIRTLTDLCMPLLMCGFLVLLRLMVNREVIHEPLIYKPFAVEKCFMHPFLASRPWIISFSPNNSSLVLNIMNNVLKAFQTAQPSKEITYSLQGFGCEKDIEDHVKGGGNIKDILLAAVVFDDCDLTQQYPTDLKIKIRFPGISRAPDLNSTTLDTQASNWRTHLTFPLYQPFGPRDGHSATGGHPGYCEEGFLFLQNVLYKEAVRYYNYYQNVSTLPELEMQRFPYPPYIKDLYLPALVLFMSMFVIIMYTYSSICTIRMVAVEKETQMKGAMKIMGLPNWMHWTAWAIKEMIQWAVPSIFITFLLTFEWSNKGCVLKYTNPVILLCILLVYSFASIMFCFLISVCFNRANTAATIGSALWFISYGPYMVMQVHYGKLSEWEIRLWGLVSNTNIGYIFQFLVNFEGSDVGLQWNNLFTYNSPADKVSAGELLLLQFFNGVMYFLLTIYMETAFPGKYGIAKPWYFPLQYTYWFGYNSSHQNKSVSNKGIEINNLTKIYSNNCKVVDNLSMRLHEDQITILLGHNGAGKTTTMSLLCGLVTPTAGTAYINGFDIWSEISHIRDRLGLCPQYDLLFPELTIKEHLEFFGTLKGRSGRDLEEEINKYVRMLEMESKVNCLASSLSGGYRRKLSVTISLVGKSKIVLMDEPTASLDPNARRRLWDLLQVGLRTEKEGRTILMTTHLMDEADVLGDRVAIMSEGQLKCIGTPFNLKTDPQGYRYTLNVVKETISQSPADSKRISEFVKLYCETARLESDTGSELKFKLHESPELPTLLNALNDEQKKYGISNFGISLISLEDVYWRITNVQTEQRLNEEQPNTNCAAKQISVPLKPVWTCQSFSISDSISKKNPNAFRKWKRQFEAMFRKKILVSYRSLQLHFIQILITASFLMIAITVTRSWRGSSNLLSLKFSMETFTNPIVIIRHDSNNGGAFSKNAERLLEPIIRSQGGTIERVITSKTNYSERFLDEHLLKEYFEEGITFVNERYIIAYEMLRKGHKVKIRFNNQPYHTVPIALNIIQNVSFKLLTKEENSLTFINAPFPYLPEEKLMKLEGGSNLGFQVGFNSGFAQAFVAGIFLLSILKERSSGAQHLQFASGVSSSAFWSASVLWDYLTYLWPIAAELIIVYLFQDAAFSDLRQLVQVFILLIAYNWAIIPVIHLSSFLFVSPSSGFLIVSMMGVVTGCSLYLINLVIEMRPLHMVKEANDIESVLIWFPHFALCTGLRSIYKNYDSRRLPSYNGDYAWKKPGIGRNLVALLVIGLVFNTILLTADYFRNLFRKIGSIISHYRKPSKTLDHESTIGSLYEDNDILQEKSIVEKSNNLHYSVLIKGVKKCYDKNVVIKNINLALGGHECFVLLGTNGAGKTTTFKMLTTYEKPTFGTISVCGMDTITERETVLQLIGYCPQHDGLIEKLTGRETLRIFCTLRGIDRQDEDLLISQLAVRLQFRRMLDTLVMNYSGGMKRKLSTAVAILGDPPVILLDEPTSGMDPDARVHLWNVIQEERVKGKCVIVTTHSLEECESLCTRLAIMVEGEIQCIGSVQYLKSKYASGHKLFVKFPTRLLENVKAHLSSHLPGSAIHEEFKGVIMFQIPSEIPCCKIFSVMQNAKAKSIIEDYSIQQTSLEQVFTQITKRK